MIKLKRKKRLKLMLIAKGLSPEEFAQDFFHLFENKDLGAYYLARACLESIRLAKSINIDVSLPERLIKQKIENNYGV